MALVLLVVSGLMVRTFVALRQVDPGFARAEEVQTFRVAVAEGVAGGDAQLARTHRAIAERLAAVPGVAAVGLSSHITMDGEDNTNPLYVEGVPLAADELPPLRRHKSVAPGFFEAMGNRLGGGALGHLDRRPRAPPPSPSSPRRSRASTGRTRRGRSASASAAAPGKAVAGDRRRRRRRARRRARQAGDADRVLAAARRRLHAESIAYVVRSNRVRHGGLRARAAARRLGVEPRAPVAAVRTLDEIQAASMARTSFAMVLLAIAAGMALFLGLVGVYGVIAYAASRRTREIGIRLALGAQAGTVRRLFVRDGLALAGLGIAIGVAAVARAHACHVGAALRRRAHRPAHLRRGVGRARGGRAARDVAPRGARGARGPGGRAAVGGVTGARPVSRRAAPRPGAPRPGAPP
jgi:hypothetical protein